jgi:hypothetical protein
MKITGRDFGPCILTVKGGVIVTADRPIRYMKNWPLQRVIRLAERWGWKVEIYDSERPQPEAPPGPAA